MLSKLIMQFYGTLIEIAIWITLAGALIGGWATGGFFAGLLALVGAVVFCTMVFGAFLVLIDIRRSVNAIQASRE